MNDPHDLNRFVTAQNEGGSYDGALSELRQGRKSSHWMWFVFPQVAGLGRSATSRRYAVADLSEARAYLAHPVLGPRLLEAASVVAESGAASAAHLLGGIDAQKLRSSMTLFMRAVPGEPVFGQVLDRFFDATPDPATDALLLTVGL